MDIPPSAQPGTVIIGDPDNRKSQYSDYGRAFSKPKVVEGDAIAAAVLQDMIAHGAKVLPHAKGPQAVKPTEKVAPKGKAKSKEVPAPKAAKAKGRPKKVAAEEPEPAIQVYPNQEEESTYVPYTSTKTGAEVVVPKVKVYFNFDFGQITMTTVDVVTSENGAAVMLVFAQEGDITFKPSAGTHFDMSFQRPGQKAAQPFKVFFTGFTFAMSDSESKLLLLAKVIESVDE